MANQQARTMTAVIRQAIVESKLPLLTLAKETGVQRASISRFVAGKRSLRLDLADKLAAYFGLQLVQHSRKGKDKS